MEKRNCINWTHKFSDNSQELKTMMAWLQILHNPDLLKHIFLFLNLKDQLSLIDVSGTLKYIIVNLIWKEKYETLHIHHTPYVTIITNPKRKTNTNTVSCEWHKDDFMNLNRTKEPKMALKVQQCKHFLMANSTNVKYLQVYCEYYDFHGTLGVKLNKVHIFTNLLQLSYHKMVVTNEQINLIAQHCRKLQKLEFVECTCGDLETLIPGGNISIGNFANMPKLEALIIHSDPLLPARQNNVECEIVLELLNELQLKCLILKNLTIIDSQCGSKEIEYSELESNSLEVLDIGCISDEFWPKFKHYLKMLCNLRDLSIRVVDCNTDINLQTVEILAATCKDLAKLSLENCDLHVENFCVFANLKELSLTCCGGMTFANLQEVMGGLQLERFTLINTRVIGEINHIYVSPTLQSITIDTILFTVISEAFQKSLNKFENLHTLNWLSGDINDNWIIDKCPNLKVLNIPNPYLLRRVVFTMKSLQEFTFTSCKGLSWRFIWILVKNLKLKRLNLQTHDTIDDPKEIPDGASNTQTTLEMIIIPFEIFKMAQEFWLDLLVANDRLKILIYGSHVELLKTNFIHNLLRHPHRPARWKYIKICGYTLDIWDLQNKFMEVMQQININTSHCRSRNMKFTMEI